MGFTISHSEPASRSALTIENLGRHLEDALTARDWRVVQRLFDSRYMHYTSIGPQAAGEIAAVLQRAISSLRMPTDWAALATTFARAAQRAADAREPWIWS
ncbi:hypothetical protein ACFTXJ_14400 [Streptomyces zhihengii]|uniref:DUF7739 domain-containing protein n=1 Tax=Streptomyces zhihengii TaxID=1818004 RepID=UPI00362FCEDB